MRVYEDELKFYLSVRPITCDSFEDRIERLRYIRACRLEIVGPFQCSIEVEDVER